MRSIDRWAIEEQGVPSLELMERAGTGVARAVEQMAADGLVVVVCGKGNNGGDGLVAARLLGDAGRDVRVVCLYPPAEFTGDAHENLERLGDHAIAGLADAGLDQAAVIVDALLGTGFQGSPRAEVADAIGAINAASAPVLSVDVPSGVEASTGVVAVAVRAAATVTFHAAKPGLWIEPGKAHAGEVETLDIGIPRGEPSESPSRSAPIGLIAPSVLELLPRRGASSTKFSSGHVLVAGGSRGLSGAPRMAAQASMRAGAGYVTACVPASIQEILASGGPPELMTRGLEEEDGAFSVEAVPGVLRLSERGGALALGPGLGRSDGALAFARVLAREANVAMVLDADGLNAHVGHLRDLTERPAATVLTPHAGELGRMLELDRTEIDRERLLHVRSAAARTRAVVVLKGDDTLIADPSGVVAVSPGNSPALATAGTGDVLTGVVAALLAQGLGPFEAAAAAVTLHAAAGREAARRQGAAEGVVASDVIDALAAVRAPSLRDQR